MTSDKSGGMSRQLFSENSPASQSTNSQSTARSPAFTSSAAADKLSTEEEVFLMNIDYFE